MSPIHLPQPDEESSKPVTSKSAYVTIDSDCSSEDFELLEPEFYNHHLPGSDAPDAATHDPRAISCSDIFKLVYLMKQRRGRIDLVEVYRCGA